MYNYTALFFCEYIVSSLHVMIDFYLVVYQSKAVNFATITLFFTFIFQLNLIPPLQVADRWRLDYS